MVTVPAEIPLTTPLLFTVATAVLLLTQVPPVVPSDDKVIVEPEHTDANPLITPAFTDAAIDTCFCELTGPLHPATV